MFNDKLRELREKKHLTQIEMADLIGVTQATYSAYENKKQTPKLEIFIKICDQFNVSADWLLGRQNLEFDNDISKADLFFTLINFFNGGFLVDVVELKSESNQMATDIISMIIEDEEILSSFEEYKTINELVLKGSLSKDVLNTWIKSKIENLSKKQPSIASNYSAVVSHFLQNVKHQKYNFDDELFFITISEEESKYLDK